MNSLDSQYLYIMQDILTKGSLSDDRTGTGTKKGFGYQISHNMSEGFPLLTSKTISTQNIISELLWFLKGDTNIRTLCLQNNFIWVGDAYKKYEKDWMTENPPFSGPYDKKLTYLEFFSEIRNNPTFANKWGELGPIYGKQWRNWSGIKVNHDQVKTLVQSLKTNPDSRRLLVSAWNVDDLDKMTLPPCHVLFQCFTRKLTFLEKWNLLEPLYDKRKGFDGALAEDVKNEEDLNSVYPEFSLPEREISLSWYQRSVDVPLGLPYNIASYGFLLEILAAESNMIAGKLVGNFGDTHIYLNQVDGCVKQLSRINDIPDLPKLKLHKEDKIEDYCMADFELIDYNPLPFIKFPLSN